MVDVAFAGNGFSRSPAALPQLKTPVMKSLQNNVGGIVGEQYAETLRQAFTDGDEHAIDAPPAPRQWKTTVSEWLEVYNWIQNNVGKDFAKDFLQAFTDGDEHAIDAHLTRRQKSALHLVSDKGGVEAPRIARFLLKNGANKDEQDVYGCTPWYRAALPQLKTPVMKSLQNNVGGIVGEQYAETLRQAFTDGDEHAIDAPPAPRQWKTTVSEWLEVYNWIQNNVGKDFAKDFLQAFTDGDEHAIDAHLTRRQKSALHLVSDKGGVEAPRIARLLLKNGANKDKLDVYGYTPWYRAYTNEEKKVIPVLSKYGAATNNDGQTPWSIVFNKFVSCF